jgi:Helix-turn-helix domain
MSNKSVHIVFQVLNFLHSAYSVSYDLVDAERLLLINLASHQGIKGIYPSKKTLCKELKKGYSTLTRIIASLIKKKLLSVDYIRGISNHYHLHIPTIELSTTLLTDEQGTVNNPAHPRAEGLLTHKQGGLLIGEPLITKGNNKGIKRRVKRKRLHPIPPDFSLNEKSIEAIQAYGLKAEEIDEIIVSFVEYYEASDTLSDDWNRMLIAWFKREMKFKKGRFTGEQGYPPTQRDEIRSTVPWFDPNHASVGQILKMVRPMLNGHGGHTNGLGGATEGKDAERATGEGAFTGNE